MSPLWRDEVGVYVTPQRLCLVRMRRGLRPTLALESELLIEAGVADWHDSLTVLDRQLSVDGWSDARARVVVADQWVRFTLVPWSDQLSSSAERKAHARELLAGVFGEPMTDWTVSLAEGPPGSPRVASAIPTAFLDALRELCVRRRLALLSVQPQLIAAYNSWCHRLPARANAWFVTVETGMIAALRLSPRGIDRVHAVRIGLDWLRELKRLQTFGRLATASPTEGRVFVDLPEALRLLHPQVNQDLEWLEEARPPLTTLHQLEYLRRKVA